MTTDSKSATLNNNPTANNHIDNVKAFTVSGFDLVITFADGRVSTVKDGLTDLVLGNIKLSDTTGSEITQSQVISSINTIQLGLDTVYLADKIEDKDKSTESETPAQFSELPGVDEPAIEKIQQENLQKKISEYDELLKKQEDALREIVKEKDKVEQQKEIIDKKVKSTLSTNLKPHEMDVQEAPPKPPIPPAPLSSSSSSASENASGKQNDVEAKPALSDLPLFISGALDEKSDSGKIGDGLTNLTTPTFIGNATPGATATLTINGTPYPLTVDSEGKWALQIQPGLPDGAYDVTLNIVDGNGKTATTTIKITIDSQIDELTAMLDPDSDSGVANDAITNNSKPILLGTAEPGAIIKVVIGSLTLTTITDAEGNWSVSPSSNLPDGSYDYIVTATDEAGNSTTTQNTLTIDTTAPGIVFSLSAATDSGIAGDFTTNITQPVLTGSTEPGATIIVRLGGNAYEIIADPQGNWELTINPALGDGNHEFTVQITDIAGNVSSQSGNLTIDTQAPTITASLSSDSDSGSSQTDNITNNAHPVLTGYTKPLAVITITFAGEHYSVKADENGHWSWAIPENLSLADGTHPYQLTVSDTAGNKLSTPYQGEFTLDTSPPEPPTATLSDESNSGSLDDMITNVATPTLVGQSEPLAIIHVTIDGKTYQTQANETGEWHLLLDTLSDGTHTITVSAEDQAGNISKPSGEMTLVIDTRTPEVTVTLAEGDDSGSSQSDGITAVNQPTFHGSATPNTTLLFTINNHAYRIEVGADGQWRLPIDEPLADDSYHYTITVENAAGSTTTIDGTLVIDTTPPPADAGLDEASDSGRDPQDGITNVVKPTLTGHSEPGARVEITFNDTLYSQTSDADGMWSISLKDSLSDGTYTYTVKTTDSAGNTSTAEHHFTIDTLSHVDARLDFTSAIPGDNDSTTDQIRPKLSGKAEPGSLVTVEFNGHSYSASVDELGNWQLTLPSDAVPGTNSYTVTAEDLAGNISTVTGQFTYIPSGNQPPKVSAQLDPDSDSGIQGDSITNVKKPTIVGQATPGVTILLTIAGNSYTTIAAADGSWSIDISQPLNEGHNGYTVVATDPNSGLSSTINNNIFIDSLAPGATVVLTDASDSYIKGDMITSDRRPQFTGKTEPGATVSLIIDGVTFTTTADQNGNWLLGPSHTLPNGTLGYTVIMTDIAGNQNTTQGNITIDSSAPRMNNAALNEIDDTGVQDRYWTNLLTPTIKGWAEPGVKLTISINGNIYDITDISSDGTWRFQLPHGIALDNGLEQEIKYWVTATDSAGNSAGTVDAIFIAKRKLTITDGLSEETDSDTKGDKLTSVTNPTLQGTISGGAASDNLHGTITIGGKTYPLTITDGGTHWSFSLPADAALSFGVHEYTLTLVDKFGTETTHTATITRTMLSGNLDFNDDSGIAGDNITNNTAPALSGKATIGSTLRIEFAGREYDIPVNANGIWTFPLPGAPLAEGEYTYKLTESAGQNTTTFNGTFTVDLTPPEVSGGLSTQDQAPNDPSASTNPNPTLQGHVEPHREVTVLIDGKRFTTTADANGFWSITLDSNLQPGQSYEYTITSTDSAGNTGQYTGTISNGHVQPPLVSFGTHEDYLGGESDKVNEVFYNTSSPTLIGHGTPGDTITLSALTEHGQAYTATVNADGTWKIDLPPELFPSGIPALGATHWSLTVTDSYGIQNTYVINMIPDITPPSLTGELDPLSDSGIAGDGITNVDRPTLKGTTEPGLKVTITLAGQSYTVNADDSGQWQFTVPRALADGTYDYQIVTVDKAGNSATILGSVTIDSASLVLNGGLDSQADPNVVDGWTNNHHQTLKGITEPGAVIAIVLNGISYTPVVSATGEWTLDLPDLPNGHYAYTITATNTAGTTAAINGQFTIDDLPPTTTVRLSAASDSGVSGDAITNVDKPTFIGQTKPGATVTLHIDGHDYTTVADHAGNWQITVTTPLGEGEHDYRVSVTDRSENSSTPVEGALTIKTEALIGQVTGGLDRDSDSGTLEDSITNNATPNFSGSAPAGVTVIVTIEGKTYRTVADQSGHWKLAVTTPLSEGDHPYQIVIKDVAGNQSAPLTGSLTLDRACHLQVQGLASESDSGTVGDGITNNTTPTLIGLSDAHATITLTIAGNLYTTTADASGQWRIPLTHPLGEGNHDYHVVATDSAGNTSSSTAQVTIDTQAPSAPGGGLASESDSGTVGDGITNNTTPTLIGLSSAHATITLTIAGNLYTTTADASGQWRIPLTHPLDEGSHDYHVVATDNAGNTSSSTAQVTIDTQAPSAPGGGLSSTSDSGTVGDNITTVTTPMFNGTTEPNATIALTLNNQTYRFSAADDGTWRFTLPESAALSDGTYHYTLQASDKAGNVSAQTQGSITIDTQAPAAPDGGALVDPDGDNIIAVATPVFNGTTEPNAMIMLTLNQKTYLIPSDNRGAWYFTLPESASLSDGTYHYTLQASDVAGNTSALTTHTLTIDTRPPEPLQGALVPDADGGALSEGITQQNTPTFSGSAEAHAEISLSIDHKEYVTTADDAGKWQLTVDHPLTDATYDYTITAKDAAGNASQLHHQLTVDTFPPTQPNAHAEANTLDDSVTLKGTVDAQESVQITVTLNGHDYQASIDGENWQVALPSQEVKPGENPYTITATDAAGNTATASGTFTQASTSDTPPHTDYQAQDMAALSAIVTDHINVEAEHYEL
ncbi:Ig-like domain-containing protein [Edwardsiella piscicida]|uniref:Ig-like domain-containing protein n=1 Tax=Edwardsiella piscicida TaxID=1263550 RepID=UPI00370DC49E